MRTSIPKQSDSEHDEGFFVSMTDMMVGIIFLFIIMLMFFAMKFSDDSKDLRDELELLDGSKRTRDKIVEDIYNSLKNKGVDVKIDKDNGVLRLPESILFASNKYTLTPNGQEDVKKLAHSLAEVLPCYTRIPAIEQPKDCLRTAFSLEALLIEGHTDSDGNEDYNWDLSMKRAFTTYKLLIKERSELAKMCRKQSQGNETDFGLLSVAGYGQNRPVLDEAGQENKNQSRRIDLRFIMAPPDKMMIDAAQRVLR